MKENREWVGDHFERFKNVLNCRSWVRGRWEWVRGWTMTAEMSGTNARLWKQVEGQGVNHDIPNLTSTSSQMTPLPPSLLPLLKWMANPTTIVHLYCSESSFSLLASPLADNTMPFQHAPHASAVCLHQNSSGCTHLAKCTIQLWIHSGLNLSSELDPWTVHTWYTSVLIWSFKIVLVVVKQ